jgi:hypothetical protein
MLMYLVKSLLTYSLLYCYSILITALELKRLLCFCANSKSAAVCLLDVLDEEAPHI